MRLDSYRKAVITGLISSIGSLTESLVKFIQCYFRNSFTTKAVRLQVKSSSAPFLGYLRQFVSENKTDQLHMIFYDILTVFQENLNSVRLMPYIFNFLDHIFSSGCLDIIFKSISQQLLTLVRTEMTSGSKPLKVKILSSLM